MKKLRGKIAAVVLSAAVLGIGMRHAHAQSQLLRSAPAANRYVGATPTAVNAAALPQTSLLLKLVLAAAQSVPYIYAETSTAALPQNDHLFDPTK